MWSARAWKVKIAKEKVKIGKQKEEEETHDLGPSPKETKENAWHGIFQDVHVRLRKLITGAHIGYTCNWLRKHIGYASVILMGDRVVIVIKEQLRSLYIVWGNIHFEKDSTGSCARRSL